MVLPVITQMSTSFKLATWHWHIEISSRCTLKCPRCARQECPTTLINTELNLDFFKRNFTKEFIIENVNKITFCGDDGDPIYAPDLIPVIQYFKSIKPTIEFVIVTNGSYRKSEWWQELAETLTSNDHIHFSIDGYNNESNNLYRVNSDFDSIIKGIKVITSHSLCLTTWACIVFKFNQHHLEWMEVQAKTLDMDFFQITHSTKFGSVYPAYGDKDPLEPDKKYVSNSDRFTRTIKELSGRRAPVPSNFYYDNRKSFDDITPLCGIGNKGTFINSQGLLFPCCWVANRYSHNNEWLVLAQNFNLYERTLDDVLNDEFWRDEFIKFKWQECQTKCKSCLVDRNYGTEW